MSGVKSAAVHPVYGCEMVTKRIAIDLRRSKLAAARGLLKVLIASIVLVLSICMMPGCGTVGTVDSGVPEKLPHLKTVIEPGVTSRSEVHQHLGMPILSSDRWGIEVFRAARGQNTTWEFPGIFIPVPLESTEVRIYAIVSYDARDIVTEIDWDLFAEPNLASVKIEDFIFLVTPTGPFTSGRAAEYLFLGSEASRKALNRPAPTDGCLLTIQTEPSQTVSIDERLIFKDQGDGGGGFIQMDLLPGKHRITIKTPFLGWRPREFSTPFACAHGGLKYAYLDIELVPTGKTGVFTDRFKNQASVFVEDNLPENFNQHKLLYHSGKWLAEN